MDETFYFGIRGKGGGGGDKVKFLSARRLSKKSCTAKVEKRGAGVVQW